MNNNTTISPAEYFAQVKSRKQVMTEAGLTKLYENCLTLLDEYQRSGQIAAQILPVRRSYSMWALTPLSIRVMLMTSSTW